MDFALPSIQIYSTVIDETILTFIYLQVTNFDYSCSQVSEDEFEIQGVNG